MVRERAGDRTPLSREPRRVRSPYGPLEYGSVVERLPDKREIAGSIPATPTLQCPADEAPHAQTDLGDQSIYEIDQTVQLRSSGFVTRVLRNLHGGRSLKGRQRVVTPRPYGP